MDCLSKWSGAKINVHQTKINESEKLTVFDVNKTAIQYAGYAIDVNSTSKENIVDLYYFKNLTTINFLNCRNVEYIQLYNDKSIILKPYSFNGCTNLKRVYGHYLIKYITGNNVAGMFKDCTNYSIHGDATTWKNKNIRTEGTEQVKSPIESSVNEWKSFSDTSKLTKDLSNSSSVPFGKYFLKIE